MQYNVFFKKPGSKTGWKIDPENTGAIIFSSSIYLVKPRYINSTAPAFSLVNNHGQHISGLFASGIDRIFTGDFQNRFLVVMTRSENETEVFLFEIPPTEGKRMLLAGELNAYFQKARTQTGAAA